MFILIPYVGVASVSNVHTLCPAARPQSHFVDNHNHHIIVVLSVEHGGGF